MQNQQRPRTAGEIAKHWQALAERRRQHLLQLHRSGRWRRYYTEEQLIALMRDAIRNVEQWSSVTGEPPADADNDVKPAREAAE
jgi:uncharacterized repeat protein (TIGR03809 family)